MSARVAGARLVEVAPQATHATPSELRAAVASAYVKVTGKAASPGVLDALSAQAMLETGRGTSMINYNFGGIKGASSSGMTARARTVEVVNGKAQHVIAGFRAYGSLEEGALDYVKLVSGQFSAALAAADGGSLDAFAHELKSAHYYTASEKDYAAALHAMTGTTPSIGRTRVQSGSSVAGASPVDSGDRFAKADQIARIIDALSASASRILAAEDDEG